MLEPLLVPMFGTMLGRVETSLERVCHLSKSLHFGMVISHKGQLHIITTLPLYADLGDVCLERWFSGQIVVVMFGRFFGRF